MANNKNTTIAILHPSSRRVAISDKKAIFFPWRVDAKGIPHGEPNLDVPCKSALDAEAQALAIWPTLIPDVEDMVTRERARLLVGLNKKVEAFRADQLESIEVRKLAADKGISLEIAQKRFDAAKKRETEDSE